MAFANPVASGSMVLCQPGRVASIQSRRLTALLLLVPVLELELALLDSAVVAGNTVASLSHNSASSRELLTTVTSLCQQVVILVPV
ncbi:MAG: hypothetical protein RL560_636 [Actinomycetota bacterium]